MTCTLGGVTPPTTEAAPRPTVRVVMLRWLLVSLVLTGVIAMHVLSQHDAAGGHHGSIIDEPAAVAAMSELGVHGGHDGADMGAAAAVGAPMVMPAVPGGDPSMAACILFLVVGAGAVVLALLAGLRRRIEPFAARASASVATTVPRGPPLIGPPRISLCVLRVEKHPTHRPPLVIGVFVVPSHPHTPERHLS